MAVAAGLSAGSATPSVHDAGTICLSPDEIPRRIDFRFGNDLRSNPGMAMGSGTGGGSPPPKLLDRVRAAMRLRHFSVRTEEAYLGWVRRFIRFHGLRHPADMGAGQVSAFLTHLAVKDRVSASTQNQALSALLFLYREVLETGLEPLARVVRARRSTLVPVVLTRAEVTAVLHQLDGVAWLVGVLLYGGGLRLNECLALRVKDVDFGAHQLLVREARAGRTA